MDVDCLHEGTRAHVVQGSILLVRTYERRVRKSVMAHEFEPQQRPGPELPVRHVMTVQVRDVRGHGHLLTVRRCIGGDLAFINKVTGQTPDFLPSRPISEFAVKDEIPVVVFAAGVAVTYDCKRRLSTQQNPKGVEELKKNILAPWEDATRRCQKKGESR